MHLVREGGKILFCLLMLVFAGCPVKKEVKKVAPPVSTGALAAQNWQFAASEGVKTIWKSAGNTLELVSGSHAVIFNGVPVFLPDPVTVTAGNRWDIPERSAAALLKPLLEKRTLSIRTIVIDPGHGGHDSGALSIHGEKEKNLNLRLAQSVAAELKKAGFKVIMTRESDKFVTLDRRPQIAAEVKADLFISIHHNSSANPKSAGLEIFVLEPRNGDEEKAAASSVFTAFMLQKELAFLNGVPGRGVKCARFKVLRLSRTPALLIEAGFLNNPVESAYLPTAYYRKKFAVQLAETLASANGS